MLMLRSFGISPVVDHVEALKGSMNRTWEDSDQARTQKQNQKIF